MVNIELRGADHQLRRDPKHCRGSTIELLIPSATSNGGTQRGKPWLTILNLFTKKACIALEHRVQLPRLVENGLRLSRMGRLIVI